MDHSLSMADLSFTGRRIHSPIAPAASSSSSTRLAKSTTTLSGEIDRLHSLWSGTKRDFSKTQTQTHTHTQSHMHSPAASRPSSAPSAARLESLLIDANDKITFLETTVRALRSDKAALQDELKAEKERSADMQQELASEWRKAQISADEVSTLSAKVRAIHAEKESQMLRTMEANKTLQAQLDDRLELVTTQQETIELLRRDLREVTKRMRQAESDREHLEVAHQSSSGRVEKLEKTVKTFEVEILSRRDYREEIDRLQSTLSRLYHLLSQTSEYRQLFASGAPEMSFLKLAHSPSRPHSQSHQSHQNVDGEGDFGVDGLDLDESLESNGDVELETEAEAWIPTDVLREVTRFRDQVMPDVQIAMFHELLGRINRVWLERERAKIDELRNRHKSVVTSLKRQILQKQPFQSVIYEERIAALRKEIRRLKKQEKLRARAANLSSHDLYDSLAAHMQLALASERD